MDNVNVPDTSTVELDKNMSMEACEQNSILNDKDKTFYIRADAIVAGTLFCKNFFIYHSICFIYRALTISKYIFPVFPLFSKICKEVKEVPCQKGDVVDFGIANYCNDIHYIFCTLVFKEEDKNIVCKREAKNGYWHKTCYFNLCFKGSLRQMKHDDSKIPLTSHDGEMNQDLAFFDVNSIVVATDNFSIANKLGEGGFGSVYKGLLANGQEVAVKRLSMDSGQGLEQFKNEVMVIANLQHRNLVRLYGCCINSEEKMLIYEYLPKKSLDFIP
ncbi:putative G-type lectin S-receptor-like serine/threonine-protein kinase At1g61610 [Rosa chinensis]|uniref:putative G-type lectin S-receptor-like serine/threonine-protein kinase At1g61610 n=1 Tax=Rosa chinensis TaxID=74649 RepID=UPI001AD91D29|nr:putative G-type lectin S-receptor-like serine/threonine-protein kinase At1g61610 [Rosa chinensis]